MKAVQVSKAGGNFEVVERNIPEPGLSPEHWFEGKLTSKK